MTVPRTTPEAMRLLKNLWMPLALAIAHLQAGVAAPLANADISAGECEQNCFAWVLLGNDVFFVWKGEQHPQLVLPLGPADGESVSRARAKIAFTPVRGELRTDDCVADCETAVVAANMELTVRRGSEGGIKAIWARAVGTGRGYQAAKTVQLGPVAGGQGAAGTAKDAAGSTAETAVGPRDVECRGTVVHELHNCHCIGEEIVLIGAKLTVDCRGNALDVQAPGYRLPLSVAGCICSTGPAVAPPRTNGAPVMEG